MNDEVAKTPESGGPGDVHGPAVLVAVFVIATCGLVYELIAGTLASYVLGDSVTQFSTVIGVYLSAMGLGAWLSRFIDKNVIARFIEIESAVALVGGLSAALLFVTFSKVTFFQPVLYSMVLLIGTLVGLEIPLLMRILKDQYELKDLVARVLTVDYMGALVASLAFPLLLVPKLGLVRGALVVGCLNAVVAIWSSYIFRRMLPRRGQLAYLRTEAIAVLVLLLVGIGFADRVTTLAEDEIYPDPIVFAKTSSYQRVVMTRSGKNFQLYLNSNLQFSSTDEHRYHEALVHPPVAVAERLGSQVKSALVLGGGDGLAVRELLKYPSLESVVLVDLDPMITELGREQMLLRRQNDGALDDPRVEVVNADAMVWLDSARSGRKFDVVIVDFPDPNNFSLGKLYTTRFYRSLQQAMAPHAALAVQSTSPLVARRSFWCVVRTIEASGFSVRPYHANVPSFGEWGYVLAAPEPFDVPNSVPPVKLSFLTSAVMRGMFDFPRDMAPLETEINRLNNQILVQYYDDEWARFY